MKVFKSLQDNDFLNLFVFLGAVAILFTIPNESVYFIILKFALLLMFILYSITTIVNKLKTSEPSFLSFFSLIIMILSLVAFLSQIIPSAPIKKSDSETKIPSPDCYKIVHKFVFEPDKNSQYTSADSKFYLWYLSDQKIKYAIIKKPEHIFEKLENGILKFDSLNTKTDANLKLWQFRLFPASKKNGEIFPDTKEEFVIELIFSEYPKKLYYKIETNGLAKDNLFQIPLESDQYYKVEKLFNCIN